MTEVCNGIDDNCDSVIDDIANNITDIYGYDNVGECKTQIQQCSEGAWHIIQNAAGPTAEVCDGIDNNCNGVVDENISDIITDIFGYDNIGECRPQIERCIGGVITPTP
jgi:hypothetical protein